MTISVVKTEPIPQGFAVLRAEPVEGGGCNGCHCCNGSCAGYCNGCAGKYLFWITHPTRYLGALSKTEELTYISNILELKFLNY